MLSGSFFSTLSSGDLNQLVFGVLDVKKRDVMWLELCFGGQIVQNLSVSIVESLLKKLDFNLKIGDLLKHKAKIQGLEIIDEFIKHPVRTIKKIDLINCYLRKRHTFA